MVHPGGMQRHLLLGRDHGRFGALHVATVAPGVAVAISAGQDPLSPSMRSKGELPNEDGLLVASDGDTLWLAVADAHFGASASHVVLTALAEVLAPPAEGGERTSSPPTEPRLWLAAAAAACPKADPTDISGTTLVLLILNRRTGQGQGLSVGDSSCVQVSPTQATWGNTLAPHYLHLVRPDDFRVGQTFAVTLAPGELLLLFTDGINECHYGSPKTSVGAADLVELYGPDPLSYARRLAARALNGVGGHPGGQDNIALIVVRG